MLRTSWLILAASGAIILANYAAPASRIYASHPQDEQQKNTKQEQSEPDQPQSSEDRPSPPKINEDDLEPLSREHKVWFDRKNKFVVVDGEVCLRQGPLEVFACPQGTKEHESVIKLFSDAKLVHTGLLRVGAIPGGTVRFDPEYRAAWGPIVDVWVYWKDEDGKPQTTRGQDWVRHSETKKALSHDWVFGGSGFWVDEESGEHFYQAEGGELICLSNFSTATMDLPIESSQSNAALLFEPFTERIPNRGTAVRLVLKPRPKAQKKNDDKANSTDTKDSEDRQSDR